MRMPPVRMNELLISAASGIGSEQFKGVGTGLVAIMEGKLGNSLTNAKDHRI